MSLPYWNRHHVPSLAWCDNGDLLATAFTAPDDGSDQMAILISRLREGQAQWDPPTRFFIAPDRNVTSAVLYNAGKGELHHYRNPEGFARVGGQAGWIAGIHAPVVELKGGWLLAFGRTNNLDDRSPFSRSRDGGRTWKHTKLIPHSAKEPHKAPGGGYLSCVQTPDRMIHLVNSRYHWSFNLAWLKEPMPAQ